MAATRFRIATAILFAIAFCATAHSQAKQLGIITFPTSGSAAAQPSFIEGVKELHSFQFDEAALAFQKAEQIDPNFAMAYWGEAMSHNHPLWAEVDVDKAKGALEKLAPTLDARLAKARDAQGKGLPRRPSISSSTRPATSWPGTTPTPRPWPRCTQSGPMTTKWTSFMRSRFSAPSGPATQGFAVRRWPRPSL